MSEKGGIFCMGSGEYLQADLESSLKFLKKGKQVVFNCSQSNQCSNFCLQTKTAKLCNFLEQFKQWIKTFHPPFVLIFLSENLEIFWW